MKIYVVRDEVEYDVTEGVTRLFDLLVESMDWGSGFLDQEDVDLVRTVQDACGFEVPEYYSDECQECGHNRSSHGHAEPKPCRVGPPQWRQTRETDPEKCNCPALVVPWAKRALTE